jgi:hypothetical protein
VACEGVVELTASVKVMFNEVADVLLGAARRRFMARLVGELGKGGQRAAERELGWDRDTIRKGQVELRTGVEIPDGRANNRAKTLEERSFPDLRADLDAIVRDHSQTDPTFRTTQRYRRLTVAAVLRCLAEKGYERLPSAESIRTRLNEMGYKPLRVRKTIPQKKFRRPMRSLTTSPR